MTMPTWMVLALGLGVLALRDRDGLKLDVDDLGFVGAAVALAVVQQLALKQVTLDDPFFAPWVMALPVIAGQRRGLRAGVTAAATLWVTLYVMATVLPVEGGGEPLASQFFLALGFAGVTAGLAARFGHSRAAPLSAALWLGFYATRARPLAFEPALLAVPTLAVGWAFAAAAWRERAASA